MLIGPTKHWPVLLGDVWLFWFLLLADFCYSIFFRNANVSVWLNMDFYYVNYRCCQVCLVWYLLLAIFKNEKLTCTTCNWCFILLCTSDYLNSYYLWILDNNGKWENLEGKKFGNWNEKALGSPGIIISVAL